MLRRKLSTILILISVTIKAQTCWKKTITNESVFILQEKYDEINDSMCVVIVKEESLNCESLKKIKAMKPIEQDGFISKLIAKGYRVEIYRKTEIVN